MVELPVESLFMFWPWLISVVCLCSSWLFIAKRWSPQLAMGVVSLLACLVPVWSTIPFFGERLDVRMTASVFALIAYCIHPKSTFPVRLGILDGCMLGLVLIHLLSDLENTGWSIIIPIRMYGEWFVPYVMGRLALTELSNAYKLAPIAIVVAIVLACGAVFEALTTIHPWELIWGEQPIDPARTAYRFGFMRSWGSCGHPIFFAALQLSLLPWLLCTWNERPTTFGLLVSKIAPFIAVVGIIATISRAPLLAACLVLLIALSINFPQLKWVWVGLLLISVPVGLANQGYLMDTVHSIGEESADSYRNKKIIIEGEEVPFTSALARMYLLKVYGRAAYRAGVLGFGTQAVSTFPVNVPVGPEDVSALKQVWSIDNQYLLLTLRFGWAGALFFSLAVISGVIAWFYRGYLTQGSDRKTCVYFGSTVLAMGLVLLTVWMPQDFGYQFLWLVGAASGQKSVKPPHEPRRRSRSRRSY